MGNVMYLFVTCSTIFGSMQNVIFSDIYSIFSSGTSIFSTFISQFNIQTLHFSPTLIQDSAYCKVVVVTSNAIPV
jgi:hypothetical protein